MLRQHLQAFAASVAFLTRIPVPQGCHSVHPARSLGYFPSTGFLLGVAACLPGFLGLYEEQPFVRGALSVLILAWLTRGLHWDGFADVCDAAGSGEHGERFYTVLKDSRLGALGGLGLVLGCCMAVVLAGACWQIESPYTAIIAAPAIGRCLPSVMFWLGPVRKGTGLARTLLPGASSHVVLLHIIILCITSVWAVGCLKGGVLIVGLGAICLWLHRLACREAGLNGDFTGMAIILGELATWAAAAA